MTPEPVEMIRGALVSKASNIERAGQGYVRDQALRGRKVLTSYVAGMGLLVTAGIFTLVSCLIGAAALFRYVEMHYGLFEAFGAVGGATLSIAIVAALVGLAKLNHKPKPVVPLTSRLRVAAHSSPISAQIVKDAATTIAVGRNKTANVSFGLALAGALLVYMSSHRR